LKAKHFYQATCSNNMWKYCGAVKSKGTTGKREQCFEYDFLKKKLFTFNVTLWVSNINHWMDPKQAYALTLWFCRWTKSGSVAFFLRKKFCQAGPKNLGWPMAIMFYFRRATVLSETLRLQEQNDWICKRCVGGMALWASPWLDLCCQAQLLYSNK